MTRERVLELLNEIDTTPIGPQERRLIDEALALTAESGDEELEYRVRLRLNASAVHTGDTDTMLSSFAWCLAKHDGDSVRFPAEPDNGGDLMWQFKWIPAALGGSPIFPRADIDAVLADMAEHYRRAGIGMSGVISAQFDDAWSSGRIAEAESLHALLKATPRDDYSDCDACVRSESISFLTEVGAEQDALTLVDELVAGNFSCGDEPEYALSRALILYLRAGRLADAKTAHLRSYRLARNNADNVGIIANHLVFCAITGNEARGLSMLERHIGWLAHDGLNAIRHFEMLLACGVLLDAIEASGHGDVPVRGADAPSLVAFFGEHHGAWTARELAGAAWAAAARIGAAFDSRNGNDYYAERQAKARTFATERYDVPITTDTFIPVPAMNPDPTDAAGWLERALELAAVGDAERGLVAARNALGGVVGEDRLLAYSRAVGALVRLERCGDAEEMLAERIALLGELGRTEQADLEKRRGLALFGRTTEDDKAGLEAELSASSGLPADVLADVQLTLASTVIKADDPDTERVRELLCAGVANLEEFGADAVRRPLLMSALGMQAHFEAMHGDAELARAAVDRLIDSSPNRGFLATARLLRAHLNRGTGDWLTGAQDADEASRLFAAIDERAMVVQANFLAGQLYGAAEVHDEATTRLRYAVRQAELNGAVPSTMRYLFGRSLVYGGQPAEATEVLLQVFEDETNSGVEPASRAETLFVLGHAFNDTDQPGTAVDTWNAAADLFAQGEQPEGVARASMAAGRLLDQYGQHGEAVRVLTAAVAAARAASGNDGLLAAVLHTYGIAQANSGDAAALATLAEVFALAQEQEWTWLVADVTDSRARALKALGRTDEAIREALVAADRFVEASDAASGGGSELFAGRLLVEAGRRDEAVGVMRSALEHAEQIPQLRSVVALELADVLDDLGRTGEAANLREGL